MDIGGGMGPGDSGNSFRQLSPELRHLMERELDQVRFNN
jgi:hypothetical protein